MYSRQEYLISTECRKQSLALSNKGLDWNYAIAGKLDRDLHEKLLPFDSSLLVNFIQILPLISSGYFDTAKKMVAETELDPSLDEVKAWLLNALSEADDIE